MSWLQRRYSQVILAFWAVALVRFFPLFFLQQTIYFGDNYSLLVPGKLFTVQWLQQGILPLWNPTLFAGINWIGDISQSIFYPSTLFFWLFPTALALNATLVSHLFLTMVGMYALSYRVSKHHHGALLAAIAWSCSAQVTGSANNLATLQSMAWFPWVLYAGLDVHRSFKQQAIFGGVVFMQLLAGYPQHLLLTIPMAAAFSLYEYWSLTRAKVPPTASAQNLLEWLGWGGTWVKRWVVAGVIALGLSAGVLWPFVEALAQSTRLTQTAEQAANGSLHWAELIKVAFPYFFDVPLFGVRWGPAWNTYPTAVPYVTLFGLLSLVFSWRKLKQHSWSPLLLGLSGLTLVVSFGRNVPGFVWLLGTVPLLKTIRYPSSWLVITNLCLLLLVAISFHSVKVSRGWQKLIMAGGGVVIVAAVIGLVWVKMAPDAVWWLLNVLTHQALARSPFHTAVRDQAILVMIGTSVLVNVSTLVASVWAFSRQRWNWVVAILALDIIFNTQGLLLFGPNQLYHLSNQTGVANHVTDTQYRALTRNFNTPYTDFGSYWEAVVVRAPFSDSFVDSEQLVTGRHLQRLRDGLTPDWNMVAGIPIVNGYTTLLPQDYQQLWYQGDEARINALPYIATTSPLLKDWSVRYYVVDDWFKLTPAEQSHLDSVTPLYQQDTWRVYELEALPRIRWSDGQAVKLEHFYEQPNLMKFEVDVSTSSSQLVVADRFDAQWRATIDGQAVTIEKYQGMRQILVPFGKHQVQFEYWPRSFYQGSLISLGTLAGVLVYLGVVSKRPHQATQPQKKKKSTF